MYLTSEVLTLVGFVNELLSSKMLQAKLLEEEVSMIKGALSNVSSAWDCFTRRFQNDIVIKWPVARVIYSLI